MRNTLNFLFTLFCLVCLTISCSKETITVNSITENPGLSFPDESQIHPQNEALNGLVKEYIAKGVLGTSVMIKNPKGSWLGTGGVASFEKGEPIHTGRQFMIASNSKMYTAAAIFLLEEEGLLSIEDPVSKWVSQTIIDEVDNTADAQIKHLLAHTSGIRDYYTLPFEMARYNKENNNWTPEEILEYTYGLKANFEVGQTYDYSNTNYVLLGLIAEKATGLKLKEVYEEKIFQPLKLINSHFDIQEKATPVEMVNGHQNLFGNGYSESAFLYADEFGTGDGGIVCNAQDLGIFLDALMHGELVSDASLAKMTNWFDIGEGDKNGFGIEYFNFNYGLAYGHTGGVDGFISFAHYFPEEEVTIIILFNYSPNGKNYEITEEFIEKITKLALE